MNPRRLANPAFLCALFAMTAAGIGMKTAIAHYKIYLKKLPIYAENGRVVGAIPTATARWERVGTDHIESAEAAEMLGTENYLTRTYAQRNPPAGQKAKVVSLHAAYYTGMIDTVPHVPERCLTGGGMALVGGPWTVPIPMDSSDWLVDPDSPREAPIYRVRLSNEYSTAGGGRRIRLPWGLTPTEPLSLRASEFSAPAPNSPHYYAGYFFVANGGWVSSAEGVRLLAFDLKADYAYYLKVQVGSTDVSSPEELASVAGDLLGDLLGELMTCVPDWTKVQNGEWPPDNPRAVQTPGRTRP